MKLSLEILRNRNFRWALYGAFGVVGLIITAVGFVQYYPDFAFHLYLASALIVVLLAPALYTLWDERQKGWSRMADNIASKVGKPTTEVLHLTTHRLFNVG